MANLTYRQAIQQAPAGTTTKNATLTSQEIDGNFKSINDELITKAALVSPGFSGVPTAPTATAGTNTTQLATTAFVQTGLSGRQPLDAELTAISGLSANGLITRTGASTAASRSIAVSGTGLSITNADGVAGNPTVTSNATAANTASTIVARDASGNFSAGTITAALAGNAATATKLATARTISLTGDVTGSVSFDGSASASITATVVDGSHNHIIANVDGLQTVLDGKVAKDSNTGSAALPAGTTAQRSAVPVAGALRFNSTLTQFEGYDGASWGPIVGSVGLSPSFSGAVLNDGYTEEVFAVSGTTPALSPTNGSIQTWTLTGNSTPTAGTWAAGQSITLMVDDGTAYTINWSSLAVTWKTDAGSAPTLNTTGYTVIALWKVGTVIYGARVGDA